MAYDFKKLSDVNTIETMKDSLNVLVDDGGEIVKIAAPKITYDAFETTSTNEITWDGVVGDRTYVPQTDNSMIWVHMTDYAPDTSVFVNSGYTMQLVLPTGAIGGEVPPEEVEQSIVQLNDAAYMLMDSFVLVALNEFEMDGYTVKKGIHFGCVPNDDLSTVAIQYTSMLSAASMEIKDTKIKKEALPDDIGGRC